MPITLSPECPQSNFRAFFQSHSAIALLIEAGSGSILCANDAACAYYGYDAATLEGLKISDINVLSKEEIALKMKEAADGEKRYFTFRHKKSNGEIKDVEVYSSSVNIGDKAVLLSIIHDITERVEAENKLNALNAQLSKTVTEQTKNLTELEIKFQSVFEYSGIGILLLDRGGFIVDSNPAYCTMIDSKKDLIVGKKLQDYFGETDTHLKVEEALYAGFDFVQFEKKLLSKDGEITVNITLSPVKRAENEIEYILCIVENISYKKSLEKKQEEQEIMLIQQSKMAAMGEMIGAIAHQWRQPLNALAIIVQDFKSAYDYGDLNRDYVENSVKKGMSQISFMSKTIDSFRNFFKPSKEIENFCVYDAVIAVCSLVDAGFRHGNIEITIEFLKEAEKAVMMGYKNEFKQAVLNILSNAKDAISQHSQGGGRIRISGELLDGGALSLKFEDSGGGMEQSVLNRVFEPYFTTKEPGKGTGIGLYMTKTILEDHMSCKISASNSKSGAVFEILCPKNVLANGGDGV